MARSFWKVWANPGANATAETPDASPPAKAEVDLVRTVIVSGLPTQWPAVRTRVGEITVPVQRVVGVSTAAAKLHWSMLAAVPPMMLLPARGLASAIPAQSAAISADAQRATVPALAIRENIAPRVGRTSRFRHRYFSVGGLAYRLNRNVWWMVSVAPVVGSVATIVLTSLNAPGRCLSSLMSTPLTVSCSTPGPAGSDPEAGIEIFPPRPLIVEVDVASQATAQLKKICMCFLIRILPTLV